MFPGIELRPATRRALSSMDISQPTPIQTKSIPPLLDGRDLIGQARTGSGKTLAFAIPLTEQCDPSIRRVQALVLVPTRELAIQVAEVTKALCSSQRLRVSLLYGGRSAKPEYAELKNGAQIIIGTPGRTLDHLRQGTLDLSSVRYLVLDEADEMLDRGFAQDVEAILSETPSERQTALLSATLPDWVATTAKKHLRNPVSVEIDADLRALPTVEHLVYTIRPNEKMRALQTLLDEQDGSPVIVFGRTKRGVKKLARQLDTLGYSVGALQGNMSQNARERVMKEYRSGAQRPFWWQRMWLREGWTSTVSHRSSTSTCLTRTCSSRTEWAAPVAWDVPARRLHLSRPMKSASGGRSNAGWVASSQSDAGTHPLGTKMAI